MKKNSIPLFSPKTVAFLKRAGRQKNPNWLEKNRAEYEELLQNPLKHLATLVKAELGSAATGYHFPQKGIGRIKRSANRAKEYGGLFKTYVHYSASRPSGSRFERNPSLFFMIDSEDADDTVLVAGGLYMPSSRQVRAIREAIAENPAPFERLFKSKDFAKAFPGGFSDERISSRIPRGFEATDPKMDWIRLQAFFVWHSYPARAFKSPRFAKLVAQDFRQILRLNELLDQAIEGRLPKAPLPRAKGLTKTVDHLAGIEAPRREMDF